MLHGRGWSGSKCNSLWSAVILPVFRPLMPAVILVVALANVAFVAYPERPITIVVPYTPGGTVDLLARALGQELYKSLNQPIVVLNRSGAGGSIGAETVAHAANDGYTLLLTTSSPLTTNLALYQSLNYDSLRDFTPIVLAGENGTVIVANPTLGVKTFGELVARAKQQPGSIMAGTSGNGTGSDLSLAQVNKVTGTNIAKVPYNGGLPSLTAAMSGEVQVTFSDLVPALPLIRGGKLIPLAVTSPERSKAAPEIPTIQELGFPDFNTVVWIGLLAPAGTAQDVVTRLNSGVNEILATPGFRERMITIGIDPLGGTPEEFRKTLERDIPRWKQMVIDAGLKMQ